LILQRRVNSKNRLVRNKRISAEPLIVNASVCDRNIYQRLCYINIRYLHLLVHCQMDEPPNRAVSPEVSTMNTHDKYRMIRTIRTNDAAAEIEAAIGQAKGKQKLSVKDFLPK